MRRRVSDGNGLWAAPRKPAIKDTDRLARSKADTTCPHCLEKVYTAQECTKPKIDVKDRKCFVCNETGHSARCPKGKLKALTHEPAPPQARESAGKSVKYTFCLESEDGFVPAHRVARKTTPLVQAATKPAPKATTVNEIMESAFVKHTRLEASRSNGDDVEVEAVGPPPVPAVQHQRGGGGAQRRASQSVRRKLRPAAGRCTGHGGPMAAAEAARSAERLDAEVLGILKGTESDNESEEVPLVLPDSHVDSHLDSEILEIR